MIRAALRHPAVSSAAAAGASAATILGMGLIAHLRSVVHALGDLHPGWLGVAVGAEILSLPGYALAYRTIVRRYGYRQLPLRVTVDMVLAGFGLFAVLGGFSVDRLSLRGLGADPKGARDSILALGLTEIVTLAALAFVTSIALLAGGSAVPGSMLWPWAIGVPGAGLVVAGLLVSARRRPQTFGVRVQHMTTRGWLMMRILGDLARLPLAWCGIGLYFVAEITSLYAAIHAVGLRLGVGAVLIAYASGYLFSRRTLPLASAAFAEALLTFSVFWVGVPLARALAAVIVYRTLGLPLFVGLGTIGRARVLPLLAEPPAPAQAGRVCGETSQSPSARPKA